MASPTPVLPEVGSTIVPPGLSFPSRSAASIRGRPIRSFTDPPGFRYSSLASSSGPPGGASFWSRTIGVLPTSSSAVGYSRGIGRKPSPGSMPEVAPAGEDHRAAGGFDGGDDLLVALRPARLDDRSHARLERDLGAVGEGDERVRGQHCAAEVVAVLSSLLDRDPDGVDAARLPAADPSVWRPFTSTIAFEATCFATRQAKSRSPQTASLASPQTSSMPLRSSISRSPSWTR